MAIELVASLETQIKDGIDLQIPTHISMKKTITTANPRAMAAKSGGCNSDHMELLIHQIPPQRKRSHFQPQTSLRMSPRLHQLTITLFKKNPLVYSVERTKARLHVYRRALSIPHRYRKWSYPFRIQHDKYQLVYPNKGITVTTTGRYNSGVVEPQSLGR